MTEYTCPRHGQYSSVDLDLPESFGRVPLAVPAFCPACSRAAAVLKQRARAILAEQELQWDRWKQAEIPARFRNRTVANWQPSKSQAGAARIVQAWLADVDARWKDGVGLLLMGVPGVGKTHLLAGLVTATIQAGYSARYASWPDVWARCRPPFTEHPDELLRALAKVDFLALDEIGLKAATEKEQARLFELIDTRYSQQRPTLVATNATEATLGSIGERAADRLREACIAVAIPGDSYRGQAPEDPLLATAPPSIAQPACEALRYIMSIDGSDVERKWDPKAA